MGITCHCTHQSLLIAKYCLLQLALHSNDSELATPKDITSALFIACDTVWTVCILFADMVSFLLTQLGTGNLGFEGISKMRLSHQPSIDSTQGLTDFWLKIFWKLQNFLWCSGCTAQAEGGTEASFKGLKGTGKALRGAHSTATSRQAMKGNRGAVEGPRKAPAAAKVSQEGTERIK